MLAIVTLALVSAGAIWFGGRQVERSLENSATQLLRSGGYSDLEVFADGRDVRIVGSVGAESEVELIPAVVATIEGIRTVESDLRVFVPSEGGGPVSAEPLEIVWADGAVDVRGTVSTQEKRTQIVTALERVYPGSVDAGRLELRPGVLAEDAWLPGILDIFIEVAGAIDEGRIVVNGDAGVVTVAAEYPDRQARSDARRVTDELLAPSGLDFVSGLTVEDAPPPPPKQEVVELQEDLDDLIAGKVVEFELNSDELTAVGRALLDEILDAVRQFPDVPIEIAGHADALGSPEFNLDLSERRAGAVLAYLVANGERADRYVVVGYGETQPIADNETPEGRARNRRIEFIALDE
jgi:OOP family OmpA-OmpF porin